jgi:uncharacterized protein YbbK (DUF523 family)
VIHVLVSACLLGERVRYNGTDARCPSGVLDRWAGRAGLPLPQLLIEHVNVVA